MEADSIFSNDLDEFITGLLFKKYLIIFTSNGPCNKFTVR